MTRDDIIRMAHEAGLHIATDHDWMPIIALAYAQKFAEVVRADEREACAKVCDKFPGIIGAEDIQEAICARGQDD
jgi:hypothetical protein